MNDFTDLRISVLAIQNGSGSFEVTYNVFLIKRLISDAKLMEIGAGDGAFVKRVAENILPGKYSLRQIFRVR